MKEQQTRKNNFKIEITTIQDPDGYFSPGFQSVNDGVPEEVVIAQLEAYLNNHKEEYADEFDKSASKFFGE